MQHETGIKVASSIWILAMPTPLTEKILSFLHWRYLLTCQTLIDHMCIGLILSFLFCSIDLFNYSAASGSSLFGLHVSGCDRDYIEILGGCRLVLLRVNAIYALPNIQKKKKTVGVPDISLNIGWHLTFPKISTSQIFHLPSSILVLSSYTLQEKKVLFLSWCYAYLCYCQ